MINVFEELKNDVIDAGLCTHCGTCVGLSKGQLRMVETKQGPLPICPEQSDLLLDESVYSACPGKGLDYPSLNKFVFNQLPVNWLIGNYRKTYIGYSNDEFIRRNGASGGVITNSLIYLIESKMIDGAVMLCKGKPKPWLAMPIVARNREEILQASQSIYVPVPVNTILSELERLNGRFAFVGLPDQVASIRILQEQQHPAVKNISYVFGLYCGTYMYFESIRSFLRSHGIKDETQIHALSYREGEWPGYLQIETTSGRVIKAEKFYYNYLIPFYITQSSLLSVDFTNELADISVGDAWHPKYERDRKGYSVVIARTEKGEVLLSTMREKGIVSLEEQSLDTVLSMHGHMIDFKKRGAFIRMEWRKRFGKKNPVFGYYPTSLALSRQLVEVVIMILFAVGRTKIIRKVVQYIPIALIGPAFNSLRKFWKNISKPAKRKGLAQYEVQMTNGDAD